MVDNLTKIESVSAKWNLDKPARATLYQKCGKLLEAHGDEMSAFEVQSLYLNQLAAKDLTAD